jgi:hypothetical protein
LFCLDFLERFLSGRSFYYRAALVHQNSSQGATNLAFIIHYENLCEIGFSG